MDTMKKGKNVDSFRDQMALAVVELQSIVKSKATPTDNGRLTIRTYAVDEPADYGAKDVKKIRTTLNVSQAVFARMVGVSDVLVRSWENGARVPAPVARRLLDQMSAHPEQFSGLVHPLGSESGIPSHVSPAHLRRRRTA
jgi:DNA-binding transcriptional regulator YiaG